MSDSFLSTLTPITAKFNLTLLTMGGEKVVHVIDVPAFQDADGEVYMDDKSRKVVEDYRARYYGLISASEIRQLRADLGLTQSQFARILQLGEKTCSRWENEWENPSRSLNILLKALRDKKLTVEYLTNLLPESERQVAPKKRRVAKPRPRVPAPVA